MRSAIGGTEMVATMTIGERQLALFIAVLLAIMGLALAVAGRADLLGAHGFIIFLAGLLCIFAVGRSLDAPEPSASALARYYDQPTKVGILLTLLWGIVGMFFGVWVSALLAWP